MNSLEGQDVGPRKTRILDEDAVTDFLHDLEKLHPSWPWSGAIYLACASNFETSFLTEMTLNRA